MGCGASSSFSQIEQKDTIKKSSENKAAVPAVHQRGRRTSVSAECMQPETKTVYVPPVFDKSKEAYARIKTALEKNVLFAGLEEPVRVQCYKAMVEKRVVVDDVIITQGEAGDFFYVVDSGEFDVFVNGNTKPVFHYKQGGTFGELALMYNSPRAATVKATTDGILWALDRETFRQLIVNTNASKSTKYANIITEMNLFSNLTKQETNMVVDSLVPCTFEEGSIIIRQGDEEVDFFHFYIIVEGNVIFKINNLSTKVGVAGPGEYFGEKGLLQRMPRAVSVVASTALSCLSMEMATFTRLLGPMKDEFSTRIKGYNDIETQLVKEEA